MGPINEQVLAIRNKNWQIIASKMKWCYSGEDKKQMDSPGISDLPAVVVMLSAYSEKY